MKHAFSLSLFATAALALAQVPAHAATSHKSCHYEVVPSTFKMDWTGYKTTAKTPVKGTFKKAELQGPQTAKSFAALVEGLQVKIDTASVDSGNAGRDKTLAEFFFGKLAAPEIQAKVKKLDTKDKSLVLSLGFNGHESEVPMAYTEDAGDTFSATGTIDLLKLGAEAALDSLHTKCADLHKGPDGQSKTWSEVALHAQVQIHKNCH